MASTKYVGDYRLENVEKNGRLKTVAVYRGAYYRFADISAAREARPRLVICAAVFWLAQLAALLVNSDCARVMYAVMPMVLAMLPFWFASMAVCTVVRLCDKMKREQAEKLEARLAGGSLIAAVLCGAAFTGSFVSFIAEKRTPLPGDIVFVLGTACAAVAALLCYAGRSAVKTERLDGEGSGADAAPEQAR